MSATRTGNFMNWTGVTATPPGGNALNITEVLDFSPTMSSTLVPFYGDNRRFPKLVRPTQFQRKVSITTGDVGTANQVPYGVPITITATLNDALNGTGSGAITYTIKNAVLGQNGVKAANNEYGGTTLEFDCFSDDATAPDTDPFSYVVAP